MGLIAGWEAFLISPDKWPELYEDMPQECRMIVDEPEGSGPIGLGVHPKWGWFTCCSGQGPAVMWRERDPDRQAKSLHSALDIMMAWYITETKKMPTDTTVMELADWIAEKVKKEG